MHPAPSPLRSSSTTTRRSAAGTTRPDATSADMLSKATSSQRRSGDASHEKHQHQHQHQHPAGAAASAACAPEAYHIQDSALSLRDSVASTASTGRKHSTSRAHDPAVAAAAAAGHAQAARAAPSHRGATDSPAGAPAGVSPAFEDRQEDAGGAPAPGGGLVGPATGQSSWSDMLPADSDSFMQGAAANDPVPPQQQTTTCTHTIDAAVSRRAAANAANSLTPRQHKAAIASDALAAGSGPHIDGNCSSALENSAALGAPPMKRHNSASAEPAQSLRRASPRVVAASPAALDLGAAKVEDSAADGGVGGSVPHRSSGGGTAGQNDLDRSGSQAAAGARRQHAAALPAAVASFPISSPGLSSPASVSYTHLTLPTTPYV